MKRFCCGFSKDVSFDRRIRQFFYQSYRAWGTALRGGFRRFPKIPHFAVRTPHLMASSQGCTAVTPLQINVHAGLMRVKAVTQPLQAGTEASRAFTASVECV